MCDRLFDGILYPFLYLPHCFQGGIGWIDFAECKGGKGENILIFVNIYLFFYSNFFFFFLIFRKKKHLRK